MANIKVTAEARNNCDVDITIEMKNLNCQQVIWFEHALSLFYKSQVIDPPKELVEENHMEHRLQHIKEVIDEYKKAAAKANKHLYVGRT